MARGDRNTLVNVSVKGAVVAALVVGLVTHPLRRSDAVIAATASPIAPAVSVTGPTGIAGPVADALVEVRGARLCSGTPVTGTSLIATAAHCVIDRNGRVAAGIEVIVGRNVVEPRSVIVDLGYHSDRGPGRDAAFLVMPSPATGASADLGVTLPGAGDVIVAGFQPIVVDERPSGDVTGNVVIVERQPAGCLVSATAARVTATQVSVPCGLIPGASGGGLYVLADGRLTIVGIVSTLSHDMRRNGIVPLAAMHALLTARDEHTYDIPGAVVARAAAQLS
jgi:hypothetical protein